MNLLDTVIIEECTSESDKSQLYEIFLEIINEGTSYPHISPYSFDDFLGYFFPKNSKVIICKKDNEIAGGFYLKPNFAGRASHIGNAGYIIKEKFRGHKIGFYLGQHSIDLAKKMGYEAIQFNFVFKKNTRALRLWEKLGFKIIGTIPKAIKNNEQDYEDAVIMYKELN